MQTPCPLNVILLTFGIFFTKMCITPVWIIIFLIKLSGCLEDALYTRYPIVARALGLAALGRVRRASKGILHTRGCNDKKQISTEFRTFLSKFKNGNFGPI